MGNNLRIDLFDSEGKWKGKLRRENNRSEEVVKVKVCLMRLPSSSIVASEIDR